MIQDTCCTEQFEIPETDLGKKIRCPSCSRIIQVTTGGPIVPTPGSDFDAALDLLDPPHFPVSRFILGGASTIQIGKFALNQIQLPGDQVSRQHARLIRIGFAPPRWKIIDQNSANGIIINGQRTSEHELSEGDLLKIGNYTFRYTLLGWSAVSPTSSAGVTWSNSDVPPIAPAQSAEPGAVDLAPWTPPKPRVARPPIFQRPTSREPQTNAIAITGLVFGILLCMPICSLLAIICGIAGISRSRRRDGKGFTPALVGLVLGIIGIVFILPLSVSAVLPSLNRAREIANRVQCAQHLRTIHTALTTWSGTNNGAYPQTLDTLVVSGLLLPTDIVCPDAPTTSTNYILVATDNRSAPDTIIVYEPLTNHADGINVLCASGKVLFLPLQQAQSTIAALQNRPTQSLAMAPAPMLPALAPTNLPPPEIYTPPTPPVFTPPSMPMPGPTPVLPSPHMPPPTLPPTPQQTPQQTGLQPTRITPPGPGQQANPNFTHRRHPFPPGQTPTNDQSLPPPIHHADRPSDAEYPYSSDMPPDGIATATFGGTGGGPYTRTDPTHHFVIGFAVQLGDWSGHVTLGHVYPLYITDTTMFPADAKISLAHDGYAVGGIIINKIDGADAMKIIYMRINGAGLDPKDIYTSDWLGDTDGGTRIRVAGKGQPVIGTIGRQGMNNDALGLIFQSIPTTNP
jgi:hypothetical protein